MVEAWLQLYTLGPFAIQMAGAAPEAAAQGGPSPLRRKTRALLAYLAAAPAPVRRETLAAQLFGASDDPLGALRWQLSLIRRQLGPVLRTVDRGSLQLNREACWIDTAAFERDLAEGSTERLAAALRLYRGEYLAGLSLPDAPEFELWLLGRRAHYRKRYEQVLAELATALITQGRLTDALS